MLPFYRQFFLYILVLFLIPNLLLSQPTETKPSILDEFKSYFTGTWQGAESGNAGAGAGSRTYESVVQDTYFLMKNQSVFAPGGENQNREFHEDWGVYSLDNATGNLVYRQFNSEGFVNTYETVDGQSDSTWVFETRHIENLPGGWKAKITIDPVNQNKFTETFELARPGQEYQRMLTNVWIKTSR